MIKYLFMYPFQISFILIRKLIGHRKFKRHYYGVKKIEKNINKSNDIISELIATNKPFLVSRYGDTELKTMVQYHEKRYKFRKDYSEKLKRAMHMNAGFFPATTDNLDKFSKIMIESSNNVDVFGVWYNFMESFIVGEYAKKSKLVYLENLEPYRSLVPWSKNLSGKKVLVVHPFTESIEQQYKIKDKLFQDVNVLPDFELITYKSVQSNAGAVTEFNDWFDALTKMKDDIAKIDFDIAIVGCGSYGLPLSSMIKDMGKSVIHLAGATQILFGVRGARWDSRKDMKNIINDHWIRPNLKERPKDADLVEGACYW